MNEKLKQKLDRAKAKIQEHAPEILGLTAAVIGVAVAVRAIKKDLSNPIGYAVLYEDTPEQTGEDSVDRASITADEMKRGLKDKTISAYSVEGTNVTFYDIADSEED